jgi:signal transduction histidine kinase
MAEHENRAARRDAGPPEAIPFTRRRGGDLLQDANRLLGTILDNAGMQIALLDRDLSYVRVNGPYAAFRGLRPAEMEGRRFDAFPEAPEILETLREALDSGGSGFAPAQPMSGPDGDGGNVTYWDWTLVPVQDADARPDGLILMLKEATHRLEAEKALTKSREALLQAQKMEALGLLVAGVAHEINNPVNQIMFNTPLIQRVWQDLEPALRTRSLEHPHETYGGLSFDFLHEHMPQLLANMDMAANRIARIVSDLKHFSTNSSTREKARVQLNAAVQNAMRLAQTTLRKAGTSLRAELDDSLPLMEGNIQSLEQIVLNLLINAFQAMEGRTGEVWIRTRPDGAHLLLSVSDSGRGVPDAIADRIFDPFVTDRQGEGGTGLGLSVTHDLVRDHDGEIRFETRRGEGTTFHVSFPRPERQDP